MDVTLENVTADRTGHLRLLPNLNRSGRTLPEGVSGDDLKTNAKLDKELPTRQLSDKEIYSLMIDISDAEAAANPKLTLEATYHPALFSMLNASGIPLAGQDKQPFTLDLSQARKDNTKARGVQFYIEAQTFAGSPLIDSEASVTMAFRILDDKGAVLLDRKTFRGADIRTADLILLGDDAPAERVFMCDVGENGPSITEFTGAAKAAGVPLTIVPLELSNGDSWIQDQFQMGYTRTNQAAQRVILHLPRMANDSAMIPGSANLRNVVDTYFPSNDIGVVKDFWKLPITVSDDGWSGKVTMDVSQSYLVYKRLSLIETLLRKLVTLLFEIDRDAKVNLPRPGDIFAARFAIEEVAKKVASYQNVKPEVLARVGEVRPAIGRLSSIASIQGGHLVLMLPIGGKNKKLIFAPDLGAPGDALPTNQALYNFFGELLDVHSSWNYGGNIEVSPPMKEAPYGKILAGSISAQSLRDFLSSRGRLHPVVTVFTGWLEVGHIDEIAAFAPAPQGGFCVLRGSPQLTLSMLDQLVALQMQGTLVTRLFRGKKWAHTSTAKATDPLLPPEAYIQLLKSKTYDLSGFDKPIPKSANPSFGNAVYNDDRKYMVINKMVEVDTQYAAMISCADLLSLCRIANRSVEDLFLANTAAHLTYKSYYDDPIWQKNIFPFRLDKVVGDAFPGAKIYLLPALFDYANNFKKARVSAIIPATVNFQTLGKHVMVPRPYGPRMRVADAASFVSSVIAKLGYSKAAIDEKFIRSRGLDKTWHWTRAKERISRATLSTLPTEFDKEYEEWNVAMWRSISGGAVADILAPLPDLWDLKHRSDPLKNHPVTRPETLLEIADYFKDGFDPFKNGPVDFCKGDTESVHPAFDKYLTDVKVIREKIRGANPNVFDKDGNVIPADWTRIVIPEDTTDVFELFTQVLMEQLGLTVCWIDSWYYHTHKGGIHCGTNVLRTFAGGA